MIIRMTMGSILRFVNTVGASWSFALGNLTGGLLCVLAFGVVTVLELRDQEQEEDEE